MSKTRLIGSAGSKDALEKRISEYFYSTCQLAETSEGQYSVLNSKGPIEGCIVRVKGGRWRFEQILEE